ncbi:MAG TPA: TetR/AcrR family transcriptional regulator [Solirubrobacterales bacterium]|jgi:AcrR family transcriptional regulator|nr:TetR/AcrR family transcriptional regulator [Solirubrobacterales bacterium]
MTEAVATGKRQYRMKVRAQRSEETAERIREVALERFLSRSYDDVTLTEVAEAAAVTVPTLIAHFGRKEDLFATVVEGWGSHMIESRDEAPVGDHAGAIRNLLDHYDSEGDRILHLLAEEDRFPAVRAMTDEGRKFHREWVERIFEPSLRSLLGARREQLVIQMIVATDLLTWKLMRLDMKLSRRRTEAAIVQMVDALTGAD